MVNLNSRIFITTSVSRPAVSAKFLYTPFGEVIDKEITNPDCDIPVGFAGAFGVLREPNGLYYMNARYYDPTIGRFLSEDPLGLGGGDLTLYSYAGNNPMVFVDPSGLCAENTTKSINWETFGYGVAGTIVGATSIATEYYTMLNTATKSMSPGIAAGNVLKSTGTRVGGATMLGVGVLDIYRAFQGKSSIMKKGLLEMPKTKIDALIKFYPYPGTL